MINDPAQPSKAPVAVTTKISRLIIFAFALSAVSVVLMIIALVWTRGADYGPILLMSGGTTILFTQAFMLWPISSYYLKTEPTDQPLTGMVKYRHVLFCSASMLTLIAAAIGIIWRGAAR